jgi:uncharacterized RDD family membrane protein YckC
MYCHRCKAPVKSGKVLCENCLAKGKKQEHFGRSEDKDNWLYYYSGFAGFWKRLFSFIVDIAVLIFIDKTIAIFVELISKKPFASLIVGVSEYVYHFIFWRLFSNLIAVDFLYLLSITFSGVIFAWLYFAFFESSRFQATLGKFVFRLVVTDVFEERISFLSASFRYFSAVFFILTFGIGFLMSSFTIRKQSLHDKTTDTLVFVRRSYSTLPLLFKCFLSLFLLWLAISWATNKYLLDMNFFRKPIEFIKPTSKSRSGFRTISPSSEGLHKYTDEHGRVHYVDSKDKIPERYREK